MNRIEKVISSNMCCGCGLCVASPDDMIIDEYGFARPLSPIFDDVSLNCCPGIGVEQLNHENYDLNWGPIYSSNVGYSTDSVIRKMGSSGGVITALLNMCLHEGFVDAVIQTGASDYNPIANQTRIVASEEETIKYAGSRYAPSSPLSVIRQIKGNGTKYAFVGKPCDVAALRMAMRVDAQLKEQFPVLLSFMCAGVPSEHATKEIIHHFGLKLQDITEFRYRGDGWPGLTKAVTKRGKIETMTYNESWGTILNKQLQARCKVCADGTGELADIVCADAWHESENGYPSFQEFDGRSLIIVRTLFGSTMLDKAIELGYVGGVEDFKINTIKKIQPYQYNRKRTLLARSLPLRLFGIKVPNFVGYSLFSLLCSTSPLSTLRALLGAFRRIISGRF